MWTSHSRLFIYLPPSHFSSSQLPATSTDVGCGQMTPRQAHTYPALGKRPSRGTLHCHPSAHHMSPGSPSHLVRAQNQRMSTTLLCTFLHDTNMSRFGPSETAFCLFFFKCSVLEIVISSCFGTVANPTGGKVTSGGKDRATSLHMLPPFRSVAQSQRTLGSHSITLTIADMTLKL